jgi:type IV pilus assembly protein PilY1
MNAMNLAKSVALGALCALSLPTAAEDIDIFTTPASGSGAVANVLIVLDNTSNWSANNQAWPGNITQGQAEVDALSKVISKLNTSVNVGLMVLTTVSGNPGGMVVFGVNPMTQTNINNWTT